MEKLLITVKRIIKKTGFSCFIVIALIILLAAGMCSCEKNEDITIKADKTADYYYNEPCTKKDGTAFQIAVFDEGPPIESSYLWLKGMVEKLQNIGYLDKNIDFSQAPDDFDGYYEYLVEHNDGKYVKFLDEPYYVGGDEDEQIGAEITAKIKKGEIDVIAATGTLPGVFLKELGIEIPFLVSMASDPVGSGIVSEKKTAEESNIWALIEDDAMSRQFRFYQKTFGFRHVGVLYLDEYEEIAEITTYEETADDIGIEFLKAPVFEDEISSADYINILRNKVKQLVNDGMDAFILSIAVVPDDDASVLLDILTKERIPYLISDGNALVETGGLMCLSCFDYEGYGNRAAMVLSNIFHGLRAGDQNRKYTSSPVMSINLTTAQKLGYKTTFDILQFADKVYRNE